MFGQIFHIKLNGLELTMRPWTLEEAKASSEKVSSPKVQRFIRMQSGTTPEGQSDWYNRVREDRYTLAWAIVPTSTGIPIGTTSIHGIRTNSENSCYTGILIFDTDWWRKRVASTTHIVRTWVALEQENVATITSGVYTTNVGSWRALVNVGYRRLQGKVYGARWADGKYHAKYELQLINPRFAKAVVGPKPPKAVAESIKKAQSTIDTFNKAVKEGNITF